jgi:PAS domain S-box-containing protein
MACRADARSMTGYSRFSPQWRERKLEALERQRSELHFDPARPWERHPVIAYEVTEFEEYLKMHPAVALHVGRTRREILAGPGWEPYIHPEDLGRVDRVWRRYCLQGRPFEGLECRYRHSESGRYVYLEAYAYPISWERDERPRRFSAWFKNITDRKRAEINFLLNCLGECDRPTARHARSQIVDIAFRENVESADMRLSLLGRRLPRHPWKRPPR